jgi:hypothetical protein
MVKLAGAWGRNFTEKSLLFLGMISIPLIQEFFGGVEIYAPIICLSAIVLWLYKAFLERKTSKVTLSVAAFFNYLHHISTALFLPLIAGAWIGGILDKNHKMGRRKSRIIRDICLIVFFALFIWIQCLFLLALLRHDFNLTGMKKSLHGIGLHLLYKGAGQDFTQVFLTRTKITFPHIYGLGSSHLRQTFTEWMFLGPFSVGIFIFISLRFLKKIFLNWKWTGLAITGWLFLVTAAFLSPRYPYPKDWDLFAPHCFILNVISLIFAMRFITGRWRRYIIVTLFAHQLIWTIPWIYYNHFIGVPLKERFFSFF